MPLWSLVALVVSTLFSQGPATGARNPAYARDGRLAVSVQGDLWIVSTRGEWSRVTSGPAWDREPAWTPDGTALVFSSDRGGSFSLWRVAIGTSESPQPERVTSSTLPDGEPVVAADGRIYFVRGRLGAARIWVHKPDGSEARLSNDRDAEDWPAISADGSRLAFVALGEGAGARRLHVRNLATGQDTVVLTDPRLEHAAWAPDGGRLSWTATGARGGVYVTPLDGHYANLVTVRHAESAWSPDGKTLALADIPPSDIAPVAYNGDPDRTGDREANVLAPADGKLWTVNAPSAPDDRLVEQSGAAAAVAMDREQRNADAFDQLWNRTAALYYSSADAAPRRAQWEALRGKYRPLALAAKNDDELESAMHELVRQHPPYRQAATGRAAVSSAHPVATAAGVEMLAKGGNVVDAAVAISFALGVVEPDASGPGGYGQMLIYEKGMDRPQLIEFMSRVPEDAGLGNTSLLQNGRLPDGGPVVVNVPGTVAAMRLAWEKYGSKKIPWSELVQPAIRAARDGYVVSEGLATTLETERDQFMKYDGSRALFFRDGQPLHAGDTLKNPDLAWTLEQIAKDGADALYRGEVGRRMVNDLHAHGNAMKLSDLEHYYAAEREPVSSTYRGYTFFSTAPPVSGGAELAAKLNLLEQFQNPKPYEDDAATLHAMIAAWQLTPSTRNRIADPSFWPTTTEPFTNKDTARARWGCFDPNSAIDPRMLRGDTLACAKPQQEDGDDRVDASAGVRSPWLRCRSGRVVPVGRDHRLRRRGRRRQRRGRNADPRHVGRQLLRDAGTRIFVQRQTLVVRKRSQRVRSAAPVRAAREHHLADDRVRRRGCVAPYRDGAGRGGQQLDHVRRVRDVGRHDRRPSRSSGGAGAAALLDWGRRRFRGRRRGSRRAWRGRGRRAATERRRRFNSRAASHRRC